MSEDAWRRKRYYNPRVILDVADVLVSEPSAGLYCLSSVDVSILLNLLQYAHRRSTYAHSYHQEYYLAPDNDQWDAIEATIAELEGRLMSNCCEEVLAALAAIDGKLADHGATFDQMLTAIGSIALDSAAIATDVAAILGHMPDVVTALECICGQLETVPVQEIVLPDWPEYPGAVNYFDWSSDEPNINVDGQENEPACLLAQAWYQAGYELMTEVILPSMRWAFDTLIPAAAATLAAITGGTTIPVAMGVYAFAELIQELLELGYDAAETNLENWLWSHKQDLVCAMYTQLQSGGTSSEMWWTVYSGEVQPSGDISAGDKLMVRLAMGGLALSAAKTAQTVASDWFDSVTSAGYCEDCGREIVVGADWWAWPVPYALQHAYGEHPEGAYWENICWDIVGLWGTQYGKLVALIYEVSDTTECLLKRMHADSCGCPYDNAWPNTSPEFGDGQYFAYEVGQFNYTQCKSVMCPTAVSQTDIRCEFVEQLSAGFHLGYDCEGNAHIRFTWLVFKGTSHP